MRIKYANTCTGQSKGHPVNMPLEAQRVITGLALLNLNIDDVLRWVFKANPPAALPPGRKIKINK
jgi:hypothetical protein